MHTPRTQSDPTSRRASRALAGIAAATSVLALLGVSAPAQAQGDGTAVHSTIVSANPADFTPAVDDGIVESVVQVGNQIVIGGTFTRVNTKPRAGLAAFDATTGALSETFTPSVDGEVTSLDVAADGVSVYVGGGFNNVTAAGATTPVKYRKLVKLNVATGAIVTTFKNPAFDASVADVRRVGNTLWVAGKFTLAGTTARPVLVTLDATTGAVTTQSTLVFSGLHNGGTLAIREIALTPAGDKLLAIGNFTSVNGLPRDQAVLVDISGTTAAVSGWQTNFFTSVCNTTAFDTYMRDVAISPDGTYAVFATTGSFKAYTSCDSISRIEITGTSSGVSPTWVNYTGGDTTTAVAIVGSVVYAGGHFRWLNNPNAADKTGQGAVARTGLAALNPVTGLPYAWNPTRERKYGVYDFLATPSGLWVGSDSNAIGGENHPKIAFFPLSGGATLPANAVGSLPGDVLSVGPGSTATDAVNRTDVSAAVSPGSTVAMTSSGTWSHARGAMLIDSTLYTAWDDGRIYKSTVGGSSVGAKSEVNLNAGPFCTTTTSACNSSPPGPPAPQPDPYFVNRSFNLDAASITGMFYDGGRMYYTLSSSSTVYYRSFEPQSGVVGATRTQAAGGNSALSRVKGMFLAGGKIYFADAANGSLYSVSFTPGSIGTTVTLVDGSRIWTARGLALRTQATGNQPPTAVITPSCTLLACTFNGSASSDEGSITSYAWTFGDGASDTGVSTSHTYAGAGVYPVTLVVTDNNGATGTTTYQASVAPLPTGNVTFRASAVGTSGASPASVVVPATVQPGDALFLFITLNGVNTTAPPAAWTLVAEVPDGTPDMVTRVYRSAAVAGTAGSTVTIPLGATLKSATSLVAYSGVDTNSVQVVTFAAEPSTAGSFSHTAPAVPVAAAGSWILHYWADKTAGNTGWTVPGSLTQRSVVLGTGSGQVGGVTGDSGGPVSVGTWPGATATSVTSSAKATSFSLVLRPA